MYKFGIYRQALVILIKTTWPTKISLTRLFTWVMCECFLDEELRGTPCLDYIHLV